MKIDTKRHYLDESVCEFDKNDNTVASHRIDSDDSIVRQMIFVFFSFLTFC